MRSKSLRKAYFNRQSLLACLPLPYLEMTIERPTQTYLVRTPGGDQALLVQGYFSPNGAPFNEEDYEEDGKITPCTSKKEVFTRNNCTKVYQYFPSALPKTTQYPRHSTYATIRSSTRIARCITEDSYPTKVAW